MGFDQYLECLGLSKAEFAREIGVTPDTVSRWRGESPKLVMLYLGERYAARQVFKLVDESHGKLVSDLEYLLGERP